MHQDLYFTKLINLLVGNLPKNHEFENLNEINVFGSKGVGNTRLVQEVAMYLRYRYFYASGIYKIDLSNFKDFLLVILLSVILLVFLL